MYPVFFEEDLPCCPSYLLLSSLPHPHTNLPGPHGSSAAHSDLDIMIDHNFNTMRSLYFNNGAGSFDQQLCDTKEPTMLACVLADEGVIGSFVDIDADG